MVHPRWVSVPCCRFPVVAEPPLVAMRVQMAGVFHVQLLRVVAERHHQQSLEVAVHHVRHVLTGYRCRCHHLWLA